jgi:hypothetical protein
VASGVLMRRAMSTRIFQIVPALPLVFLLACSSQPVLTPDAPPPEPARYAVRSTFDVATNMPGDVGRAANVLFDATDDPDDPARFLIDLLIAKLPDGPVKAVATAAAPYLAGYLQVRLDAVAPELLLRLVTVGRELGMAARNLGTVDTLTIATDGSSATHAITGVRYQLDGIAIELPFSDYGMPVLTTTAPATAGPGALAIGEHEFSLSYGQLLRLTLDHAIVPRVDPGAIDLLGLLQSAVDCTAVGADVAAALGAGNPAIYATACRDGLTLAASAVYDDLAHADAEPLTFAIAGEARVLELATGEALANGVWTGTLTYGSAQAPLGRATFSGQRE